MSKQATARTGTRLSRDNSSQSCSFRRVFTATSEPALPQKERERRSQTRALSYISFINWRWRRLWLGTLGKERKRNGCVAFGTETWNILLGLLAACHYCKMPARGFFCYFPRFTRASFGRRLKQLMLLTRDLSPGSRSPWCLFMVLRENHLCFPTLSQFPMP